MKKGFTLIETLIVLSLIMILISFNINAAIGCRNIYNNNNIDMCNLEIVSLIIRSKHYCRESGSPGYILCDSSSNTMKFIHNNKLVYKYKLPEGFILYDLNAESGVISINKRGISGSACTIRYYDINKKDHLITMRVGTSYVEIK